MRDTVEIVRCDGYGGHACGKVIAGPDDGLLLRGSISIPAGTQPSRQVLPRQSSGDESACCWGCFEHATGRPARVVTKIEYRTETKYEPYYGGRDNGGSGSGGGATGPLPPPELPRHVRFARRLALGPR